MLRVRSLTSVVGCGDDGPCAGTVPRTKYHSNVTTRNGERDRTLWLALGAGALIIAVCLVGLEASTSKPFSASSALMISAYVLAVLWIASWLAAMVEAPLPRSLRLGLRRVSPRRRKDPVEVPAAVTTGPDPSAVADGLAKAIREVEDLVNSNAEPTDAFAWASYLLLTKDRAVALFEQVCELGYSPRADRDKIEHPISWVLLLSLLRKLEQYARERTRASTA